MDDHSEKPDCSNILNYHITLNYHIVYLIGVYFHIMLDYHMVWIVLVCCLIRGGWGKGEGGVNKCINTF